MNEAILFEFHLNMWFYFIFIVDFFNTQFNDSTKAQCAQLIHWLRWRFFMCSLFHGSLLVFDIIFLFHFASLFGIQHRYHWKVVNFVLCFNFRKHFSKACNLLDVALDIAQIQWHNMCTVRMFLLSVPHLLH